MHCRTWRQPRPSLPPPRSLRQRPQRLQKSENAAQKPRIPWRCPRITMQPPASFMLWPLESVVVPAPPPLPRHLPTHTTQVLLAKRLGGAPGRWPVLQRALWCVRGWHQLAPWQQLMTLRQLLSSKHRHWRPCRLGRRLKVHSQISLQRLLIFFCNFLLHRAPSRYKSTRLHSSRVLRALHVTTARVLIL